MKFEQKLLAACLVLGVGFILHLSWYVDARRSLKATCSFIHSVSSKLPDGYEDKDAPRGLEDAWHICFDAQALPEGSVIEPK